MIRNPENYRLLEDKGGFKIVSSGKLSRRLSHERRAEITRFVQFLTKSFKQSVHAVYLNEHNENEDKLYNVAFVFDKEETK